MAHNIENRNGKNSIVYAGETPWHRLGQRVNEAFDAQTALREGGLDFRVEKVGIQTKDGIEIPGRFAVRRTDTRDVLGICGSMYHPLQNQDAFGFFDGVFGKDKARYEVAGVLGKGEKVWLLAKLPGEFKVAGEDLVGKWLLLMNGYDTHEPIRAKFTPIRVVCQNTLHAALRGTESEVRVQHIGDVEGKLEIAAKLLKMAGVYFDELQGIFAGFSRRQITQKALRSYATVILNGADEKFEDLSKVAQRSISEIEEIHDTGRGSDIKSVRGTLWAAYNAVSEWVDHRKTRDTLGYMAVGRGAEIKQRAFSVAQEMISSAN